MPNSWKPVVKVSNEEKWHDNALRFASKDEAERSARDLSFRWLLVKAWDAQESEDPVNYSYTLEGKLIPSKDEAF